MTEIINSLTCQYDFPECDKRALAVFGGKWTCGNCLLKIEAKIKEHQRRQLEIIEQELR